MKILSIKAFEKAIDKTIEKNADFTLIAGDLFNNAIPPIDYLKDVVRQLKKLKNKDIPVYLIEGSHDYSPSGKTITKVLEEADLIINVAKIDKEKTTEDKLVLKFTTDKKTGAKITGIIGRAKQLDTEYYKKLSRENLENEPGFKIFMFHNSITELKPKEMAKMESESVTMLPKNFDYYAGGHIHIVEKQDFENRKNVIYPGPTFPTNFKELEDLENGGFYFYNDGQTEYIPIIIKNVLKIKTNAEAKNPEEVEQEIIKEIEKQQLNNTIVLIRIFGTLKTGKPSDINFKKIFQKAYENSAYFVIKNISKLDSKEFKAIQINASTPQEIEDKIIGENSEENSLFGSKEVEQNTMKKLISSLIIEKHEGETKDTFEKRRDETAEEILKKFLE